MGKAMLSQGKDFRFVSRIGNDVRKALEPKVDRIAEVFAAEHYPIMSPTRSAQGVQIDGEEYTFGDLPGTSFGDVVRVYDKTGASLFEIKREALERLKASAEEEITAAEAAMKIEDKSVKDRAKEKLEQELQVEVEKVEKAVSDSKKREAISKQSRKLIAYLMERCEQSESLAQDVCQEHKTFEKCNAYINNQVQELFSGIGRRQECVYVDDPTVYEWAEDYYHLDDKAAEEEKAKKAAEQVKKGKEAAAKKRKEMKQKQQEEKAKPAAQKVAKPEPEKKDEKPAPVKKEEKSRKKSKELDGQMDFFSMLGM